MPASSSVTTSESTPKNSRAFTVTLLSLSLPIAAQMLLASFLGIADVMMVAPLGEQAIAAVGLAAKIHFLLLVLMTGFATGGSILIAQYSGAKDLASCQRTLAVALMVGVTLIIPIMICFGFAAPVWVHKINPDLHVADLTAQFLVITAPMLLLTQIYVIYEAALRALGQTTVPLIAGVIATVINVALNYALITGHWGAPALGVAGAAWATLTARAIQVLIIFIYIYGSRHLYALNFTLWRHAFAREHIARYLQFSLPLVVNFLIWAIGNSTYHIVTGYAGTDALAVMGMSVPIESIYFSLFVGFANASAVLIGRSLGANNFVEAQRLQKFFDRLTVVTVLILASSLWFARPYIVNMFAPLTPHTADIFMQTLAVFCGLVWLKSFNLMRIIGVLRAGGDQKFVLVTDSIVMWVFGIPIYVTAVFFGNFSFPVLYALMFLDDALKIIPIWMRVGEKKWMRNLAKS